MYNYAYTEVVRMKTRKMVEVAIKRHLKQPIRMSIVGELNLTRFVWLRWKIRQYHRWKDDVQPGLQRIYRIIKRIRLDIWVEMTPENAASLKNVVRRPLIPNLDQNPLRHQVG
jgi:hypothetical protein